MRKVDGLVAALSLVLVSAPVSAQYAETLRPLPGAGYELFGVPFFGSIRTGTQIGRHLFIGGSFSRLSPPTGGAAIVDTAGNYVAGAFPRFAGTVAQVVADGAGGWLVVGDFASVDGQSFANFARVTPDRTVDPRFRVTTDGPIHVVATAHGRIYLAGEFNTVNGLPRGGLAALSSATGQLTAWASGFSAGGRGIVALSVSSFGVYLAASAYSLPARLWGFDASSGRLLFARTVAVGALAASSSWVFIGGYGYDRPIWAVDPLTGDDADWSIGLRFRPLSRTYGDDTGITGLLLDSGRLYFAGRFTTVDGRAGLAAVDAASGAPVIWRPDGVEWDGRNLSRIGPAIVATFGRGRPGVVDVSTARAIDFAAPVNGDVLTVAAAPEGVVIGGAFNGVGGVARQGLASINLDTFEVEPWTAALANTPTVGGVRQVATDGTWLFVGTTDGRIAKVDPVTGAVVAERAFDYVTKMVVVGGEIVVAHYNQTTELGVITIADWSYRPLPIAWGGDNTSIQDVAIDGNTIYVTGHFQTVNGQSRPLMAAVHRTTGAVLPWRPLPDSDRAHVTAAGGRVWVSGAFRRVGGARRRGLAELDPVSGAALPWNPDVAGVLAGRELSQFDIVNALDLGPNGNLYVGLGYEALESQFLPPISKYRPTVGGQRTSFTVAFSTTTGHRLPWRPQQSGLFAVLPDCLLVTAGCLPPTTAAPSAVRVTQTGAAISLAWNLPASPSRTAVRLEVGTVEGRADLVTLDLPATQTSFTAAVPPGQYFARVRAIAGSTSSESSDDVSFAVGAGVPAAPLDVTAVVDGGRLTLAWRPPSTGVPEGFLFEVGTAEGQRDVGALATAGSATSMSVDAVPPGRYWGRLVAVNGSSRSAPGPELLIEASSSQRCGAAPAAPVGLTATVSGRTVTLAWQPPSDEPQLDLQQVMAGSAPGLSDLATVAVSVSATSYSAAAPLGTYYVRVVADNLCGQIAASNEVQVVVR